MQDLATTNTALSSKVAELEVSLAAALRTRQDAALPAGAHALPVLGSLDDPLGEKNKELRRQVRTTSCPGGALSIPVKSFYTCMRSFSLALYHSRN